MWKKVSFLIQKYDYICQIDTLTMATPHPPTHTHTTMVYMALQHLVLEANLNPECLTTWFSSLEIWRVHLPFVSRKTVIAPFIAIAA